MQCSSEAQQKLLNVDAPFHGALLSHSTFESPATLPPSTFAFSSAKCPLRLVQPGIVLEINETIDPKTCTAESIKQSVGAIRPCLELVTTCFRDWTHANVDVCSLIADNALHGALVLGEPVDVDPGSLTAISLTCNGEVVDKGRNEVDPLEMLVQVTASIEDFKAGNHSLLAGDIVSTGVLLDTTLDAQPGDRIEADFGPEIGTVAIEIESA